MKLLSLKQTSCRQSDTVFGASAIGNAVATIICLGLVGAGIYLWFQGHIGQFYVPRFIIAFEIPFALLVLWLAARSWRAARRPTDWLLRIQGNDVLIKFRSFQNWRMSEDDPQVIVLHRDEIAFARESANKQITRPATNTGGVAVNNRIDLEIGLKESNTAELAKALADERARPGWGGPHMTTKMQDYPVELINDDVIRIAWKTPSISIRPGIKRALTALGKIAPLAESQNAIDDFTPSALKNLPEPEQHKRLATLAGRDPLTAMETAKVLYNCSLTDARQLVEQLMASDTQKLS